MERQISDRVWPAFTCRTDMPKIRIPFGCVNRISLTAPSLYQSTHCSFHKKAARCQRRSLVGTDAADKADKLQCANARACDGHDAKRVRAAAPRCRSAPQQFARRVPVKPPPKADRHIHNLTAARPRIRRIVFQTRALISAAT